MVHKVKTEKEIVKKEILKMDREGKSIEEIDETLVYDMGFSPEYSWKMIKSTLKLVDD